MMKISVDNFKQIKKQTKQDELVSQQLEYACYYKHYQSILREFYSNVQGTIEKRLHKEGCVVGRDSEKNAITEFITNAWLSFGSKASLFVAGMPGTGKTATIKFVINRLHMTNIQKKQPQFGQVQLNAMEIADPKNLLHILASKIGCELSTKLNFDTHKDAETKADMEDLTEEEAEENVDSEDDGVLDQSKKGNINERLKSMLKLVRRRKSVVVIVVDEVDALQSKRAETLQNLLDLPQVGGCAMLCVSNRMDLCEALPPRVASRLGGLKLHFAPYNKDALADIAFNRVTDSNSGVCCPASLTDPLTHKGCVQCVVHKDPLGFAAAKVASVNGDARRLCQVISRANAMAHARCMQQLDGITDALKDFTFSQDDGVKTRAKKQKQERQVAEKYRTKAEELAGMALCSVTMRDINAAKEEVYQSSNAYKCLPSLSHNQKVCLKLICLLKNEKSNPYVSTSQLQDRIKSTLDPKSVEGRMFGMETFLHTLESLCHARYIEPCKITSARDAVMLAVPEDEILNGLTI